ncbi:hypothetical protein HMPREF1556_00962 [Porphyromonas sp. oral taxon 278 str. W7784]|nr:hypothetical protein HMPREF1556_00962 [Porphyromonas sp. oral taxon 278 str. W7784]
MGRHHPRVEGGRPQSREVEPSERVREVTPRSSLGKPTVGRRYDLR